MIEEFNTETALGLQIINDEYSTSEDDVFLNYQQKINTLHLYYHGVLHSNGRIYGIPFNADKVLEIYTSNPPKLVLHSIPTFGKTITDNNLTVSVPTLPDSLSIKRIGDSASHSNEAESLITSGKIYGIKTEKYIKKLNEFYKFKGKLEQETKNISNDLERIILLNISLKFPCLELDSSTPKWKWKKGISFNDAIYFLPFAMEYVYAVKSRGNHLRFIPIGTNFTTAEQKEKQEGYSSIVENKVIKDKIIPLNPYTEIIYPSGISGYKILDHIPRIAFNPENSGETTVGGSGGEDTYAVNHAKFFDYKRIDNIIYGSPWCFSNDFHHQNENLYREKGDHAARIFRFQPRDCEFVGTFHGMFKNHEKFSGAVLFDDKIYSIPQNENSILEVIPGDDVVMNFISYLTPEVVGPISTRKFMNVVKTDDALVFVPYNSERILILRKGGLVELPLERLVGVRKFRSGVYCKKLDSIIFAPFDYPYLLMYSLTKKKFSVLHTFKEKMLTQVGKYSDILSFDDENFFCIPFGRKSILHVRVISEKDIRIKEIPLPTGFDHYFIKGIIPNGRKEIYAIPYHGSSVLVIKLREKENSEIELEIKNELNNQVMNKSIELNSEITQRIEKLKESDISHLKKEKLVKEEIKKELETFKEDLRDQLIAQVDEKEIILDEYVIFNTSEKRNIGGKFSNVIEIDSKLVCVPFNAKEIITINPGDPPDFSSFEVHGFVDSDKKTNLLSSAYKFSSACSYRNGIVFAPFGINYLLNITFGEGKILNSETINIISAKPEKYCDCIKVEDAIYFIPCTETRMLKLHSEL